MLATMRKLEAMKASVRLQAMAMGLIAGLGGSCVAGAFLTHGFTWPLYVQVALSIALWRYVRKVELETEKRTGLPIDQNPPQQQTPKQAKGWRPDNHEAAQA